jgi:UDP-N-acetylmuramoylalanine--D-glutamate ligase
MDVRGKTLIVVGLGRSGVAAAELALRLGARVIATDAAALESLSPEARALASRAGLTLSAGGHDGVPFRAAHAIVLSPGVPPLRAVAEAEAHGVRVLGELDFAWQALETTPTAAIGGTNGKSTTTTLVGEILAADGFSTFVGGNLGTPLAEAALRDPGAPAYDALVLEVSSFQAEKMPAFHPRAATILNVTADHLDRYASLDEYAHAKGNMLVRMTKDDVVVIPAGDALCRAQAARSSATIVTFGESGDVAIEQDAIVDRARQVRYLRRDILVTGAHNAENVAASVALASAMGASEAAIRATLATFRGLAHRIEVVADVSGVRYYDDSKGTNVGASVAALRGLPEPKVVLIAGGRDKLGSYEPLAAALRDKGRALVVLGEAAARIASAAAGVVEIVRAGSMDEAVRAARALAQTGDAVLLSPACSSFDMFRDYKHRGDEFARAVRALPEAR